MNSRFAAFLVAASLALTGCFSDGNSVQPSANGQPVFPPLTPIVPPPTSGFRAVYVVASGALPYPNSIFFQGSTDGTLNLPLLATSPNNVHLNTLDGFSTTEYFNVNFTGSLDPTTIIGGVTVQVVEVVEDLATGATTGVVGVLVPGVDYVAQLAPNIDSPTTTLQIQPLLPLNESSSYLVLLTNGITDTSGTAATGDTDYVAMRDAALSGATLTDPTLDQLKLLIGAHLSIAGGIGITPTNIISSANFRTQSVGAVMNTVEALTPSQGGIVAPIPGAPVGCPFPILTTACVLPPSASPSGNADIYAGTLTVSYYSDTPATGNPLTTFWTGNDFTLDPTAAPTQWVTRYNPVPVVKNTLTIPVLMTVPNANSAFLMAAGAPPTGGWPVMIFQHGITRNRVDILAIAEPLADAGVVTVGIDLPLHGVTATNPLVDPTAIFYQAGNELTFDLDLVNNATGAPGADGILDASGTHTINLTSPLTSRDSLRQGAVNLIALTKTIGDFDIDGNGNSADDADLNGSRVHFAGLSLGGMVGSIYLAVNTDAISVSISNSGAWVSQLLLDSPSFSPRIIAGLQAAGLTPGTSLFNNTIRDIQTAFDPADPWNVAADAAANHPTHFMLTLGDIVIPNSAEERMVAAMGLPTISTPGVNLASLGVVRLTAGSHGSILDPTASLAATVEMITQTIVFAFGNPLAMLPGGGQIILISDPTVVQ